MILPSRFASAVSTAVLLLALPVVSHAQTPGDAPTVSESQAVTDPAQKARLDAAMQALTKALPLLDPETQKMEDVFRAIARRVILDRGSVTKPELDIHLSLQKLGSPEIVGAESKGLLGDNVRDEMITQFKARVQKASDTGKHVSVGSKQHKVPGRNGATVGNVSVRVGGRKKTVAEIPSGAGGLSPLKRAEEVSRRIETAAQANPLWWTQLSVQRVGGEYVVAAPEVPGGYVITADAAFARMRQSDPQQLALRLMRDLRSMYSGEDGESASQSKGVEENQGTENLSAASELRERGDACFDEGDTVGAEKQYRQAVAKSPGYVLAYERLADLYDGLGDTAKRREIAKKALALPKLDSDQRAKFKKYTQ